MHGEFETMVIRLHERFCRPWAVRVAWVVWSLLAVGQFVLMALHGA